MNAPNFLDEIRPVIEARVRAKKDVVPIEKLRKSAKKARHSFIRAIRGKERVSLIAEFKKGSPSRGSINKAAKLGEFVKLYDEYADAISILTEEKYFSGKIGFIARARKLTKKPLLLKDFVLDPYQVYEARANGADAVLLIAGFLSLPQLKVLVKTIEKLGMDALVECDDAKSLEMALASGSRLIGINNRDLGTLKEDKGKVARLFEKIPASKRKGLVIVAESAIETASDVETLKGKVHAALVGTAIMSAKVPRVKLKELAGKTLIKVCGTTTVKDARSASKLGADIIGLNFYPESPRFVSVITARKIAGAVKGKCLIAGVFVNERTDRIKMIAREVGLDLVQLSGDEKPGDASSYDVPAIKAIHVKDKNSLSLAKKYDVLYIMIDAFVKGLYGGTGKAVNPSFVDRKKLLGKRLVFSGGLNASNVARTITKFSPAIVDVCSGVELFPGRKSFSKMKAFIKSAESAQGTRGAA